jgi:hypothetical protein
LYFMINLPIFMIYHISWRTHKIHYREPQRVLAHSIAGFTVESILHFLADLELYNEIKYVMILSTFTLDNSLSETNYGILGSALAIYGLES